MSNYAESIERFVDSVNTAAIDGLVKHLGIALRNPDSATVAASDDSELATVRDGFCAKHLGMSAEEADAAIAKVAETMKHDSAKCRVTFYYLLADAAGKLDQFA
jgi:energy-coupling factor transporter ATP-binding protein EcfA2